MKHINFNFLSKHCGKIIAVLYVFLAFFIIQSVVAVMNVSEDYLQGISSKILYIHVPSAWLSLIIYINLALFALGYLVFRNPAYDVAASALASVGAAFTAITLITGSIWGKPTWGTWWVWDARLTSMLILLFIYFGYMGLREALKSSQERAALASSAFAVIGLVNIPIIKLSVYLWSSLHQKSTFFRTDGPSIHSSMMEPIFYTFPVLCCIALIIFVLRFNTMVIDNKIKRHKIAALHSHFKNSATDSAK